MISQRKKLVSNKKGQALNQFSALITSIVTIGILLTVGFLIVTNVKATAATNEGLDYTNASICATSNICNGTNTMINVMGGLPDWVDLVVLVSIGAILIGLVVFFKRITD